MAGNSMTIFVCTQEQDAINRRTFLQAPPNSMTVTMEEVSDFVTWDAKQFSDGKKDEPGGKWIVIGRR